MLPPEIKYCDSIANLLEHADPFGRRTSRNAQCVRTSNLQISTELGNGSSAPKSAALTPYIGENSVNLNRGRYDAAGWRKLMGNRRESERESKRERGLSRKGQTITLITAGASVSVQNRLQQGSQLENIAEVFIAGLHIGCSNRSK